VHRVVLYSRPGCHLCDRARDALEALRASSPFDLRDVNIESDPGLERRFMLEIPVIEVDGAVVAQAPVDLEAVRAALKAISS
jgi:glutaredoxin